jgi:hypothetical protein
MRQCTAAGIHAGINNTTTMSNVIPFRKPKPMEKARGKTLCREGFHKWEIWQDKQFDVKMGKLVTIYVCKRCGERKTVTH